MKRIASVFAVIAVAAPPALFAAASIFKCTERDGSVTYQEQPCPDASASHTLGLPAEYPPVDTAARNQLLEREAALDRRLEAERDRLSAEAIARITRPDPVFVASEPAYGVTWPAAWGARPFHARRLPMAGRPVERRF